MTKKEKLHLQKNNLDKAIAFKEGFFYKVYNEGAFLLNDLYYKVRVKYIKNLNQEIYSIGKFYFS
jgi:hypothetical protein